MPTQTIDSDEIVLLGQPTQTIEAGATIVRKFIDLESTLDLTKSEIKDSPSEVEVTQTTPVAPTLSSAADIKKGDVIRLVWTGGGPRYNVFFKKTSDITFIKVNASPLPGSQTQYEVGGLDRDTSYDFQVSSINGAGDETF